MILCTDGLSYGQGTQLSESSKQYLPKIACVQIRTDGTRPVEPGDNLYYGGGLAADLPTRSNHACPSYKVKAMPVTVFPSRPTADAGTSSLTHTPACGSTPIGYPAP